jgi:hypothetical protein
MKWPMRKLYCELGESVLRIIYENYRGFTICKQQEKTYKATNKDVVFSHWRLSEVLDTVDNYLEKKREK